MLGTEAPMMSETVYRETDTLTDNYSNAESGSCSNAGNYGNAKAEQSPFRNEVQTYMASQRSQPLNHVCKDKSVLFRRRNGE